MNNNFVIQCFEIYMTHLVEIFNKRKNNIKNDKNIVGTYFEKAYIQILCSHGVQKRFKLNIFKMMLIFEVITD